MSTAQHTPGPWTINDWPQGNSDITIGAIGTPLICKVPLRDVSINGQKANARAIAALPDLIAALQSIIERPIEFAELEDWETMICRIIEIARAALAKAGVVP